jgi:adenylylsulfate kinase
VDNRGTIIPPAQAATWRILGTGVTGALVYVLTRRWEIVLAVCGVEFVIKAFLWFIHACVWERLRPSIREGTPFVLWFTGLSGSGKSTIADRIHDDLAFRGYRVARLDGDTVRSIFPETGFTREERNNHIRRIGYLASILDNESRKFVRGLTRNFIEVFVSASLEECERRDVKGLYRRARAGEIRNFTGIDDPYEPPVNPELTIVTENRSLDESAAGVMAFLKKYL